MWLNLDVLRVVVVGFVVLIGDVMCGCMECLLKVDMIFFFFWKYEIFFFWNERRGCMLMCEWGVWLISRCWVFFWIFLINVLLIELFMGKFVD